MIFFADENVSPQAVKLLEAFDRSNPVKAHKASFDPGTPDEEWITSVGSWTPKHVILGGDGRILRHQAEFAALKHSGLTFVFLADGWTQLSWDVFAWKIIKCWPAIVSAVEHSRLPSVFKVTVNEKVEHFATLASLRGPK